MKIEEAINNLKHGKCIPYKHETLTMAIRSLEAWDKVDRELKTIMEGDERTFSNRVTEDSQYYEGIYKAIKVIDKYLMEVGE
jgi:hypothetical protein